MLSRPTAGRISLRGAAAGLAAASLLAIPIALELQVTQAAQPLTDSWRSEPIVPRRSTLLGISFRPPQVEALRLPVQTTFQALLAYPFQLIRLGAYWNRIEPAPGAFDTRELDWQLDAAERAGKQIILCVGALKNFSYPEFFVPAHHLARPLPEHSLVSPATHPSLHTAATEFVERIVDLYKDHPGIVAWQVEHEAVDPLGLEHSWRLATSFVEREVDVVRRTDATRPVLLNGFLPASSPASLVQWWQTRDQGDSLTVAQRVADIVGVDYYPRYALAARGASSLYLDGARSPWARRRLSALLKWASSHGKRLMVSEGQAEPWEAVTIPPSPVGRAMSSCPPERLIRNYNWAMRLSREEDSPLCLSLLGSGVLDATRAIQRPKLPAGVRTGARGELAAPLGRSHRRAMTSSRCQVAALIKTISNVEGDDCHDPDHERQQTPVLHLDGETKQRPHDRVERQTREHLGALVGTHAGRDETCHRGP